MIEPFLLLPQNQSAAMIHFKRGSSSLHFGFGALLSVLLLLTSEGQRPGCDLKDAECLDEKQVFFQLLSELHDSKDSDPGVAAQSPLSWRRMAAAQPSLPSVILIWMVAIVGPPSTTSTPTSTVTIPVCNVNGVHFGSNDTSVDFDASVNTTVLLEIDAELAAGCCGDSFPDSVTLRVVFTDATCIGRSQHGIPGTWWCLARGP